MTWTKLGDDFTESPAHATDFSRRPLPARGGVGLVQRVPDPTDGALKHADLHWISDSPDVEAAVAALVKGGFWEVTDHRLADRRLVEKEQRLAEDVAKTNALAEVRAATSSDQHNGGDHTLCDPRYCRMATLA